MTSRRDFLRAGGLVTAGLAAKCCPAASGPRPEEATTWSFDGAHALRVASPLIRAPLRLRFIADTHLALTDERDREHADNYKRMAQWGADRKVFESTLPRPGSCDLLVLGGDIISFPTHANVDYLKEKLDGCGVPYAYVAGNHDWHFEGDEGSDFTQRARWIDRRLKPLYGGRDPLASVVKVNGCKVILIDNSLYHVTPEQLAFYRQETRTNEPMLLVLHIPLWHPGWNAETCGCPQWGAKSDTTWQIERRERWADHLLPSTNEFRDAVFATPSLVGVLAGHIHRFMASSDKGRPQWVVAANRQGDYFDARFTKS